MVSSVTCQGLKIPSHTELDIHQIIFRCPFLWCKLYSVFVFVSEPSSVPTFVIGLDSDQP